MNIICSSFILYQISHIIYWYIVYIDYTDLYKLYEFIRYVLYIFFFEIDFSYPFLICCMFLFYPFEGRSTRHQPGGTCGTPMPIVRPLLRRSLFFNCSNMEFTVPASCETNWDFVRQWQTAFLEGWSSRTSRRCRPGMPPLRSSSDEKGRRGRARTWPGANCKCPQPSWGTGRCNQQARHGQTTY